MDTEKMTDLRLLINAQSSGYNLKVIHNLKLRNTFTHTTHMVFTPLCGQVIRNPVTFGITVHISLSGSSYGLSRTDLFLQYIKCIIKRIIFFRFRRYLFRAMNNGSVIPVAKVLANLL